KLLVSLRAEDESRGARVDVFTFLKRFEHHRILCDVGQQAQFELRVIRRDDLVALLCDEGAANTTSHLAANRNVLEIRIARRQPSCRGYWLIELAVNSAVGRDLLRQSVGVNALQLVELAVVDDQARQLKLLRQFFKHGLARRDATS